LADWFNGVFRMSQREPIIEIWGAPAESRAEYKGLRFPEAETLSFWTFDESGKFAKFYVIF